MLAEAIDANVSWGENSKSVYITLTGLESTTEATSATIEEPTVSTTTNTAPTIPDAPEK